MVPSSSRTPAHFHNSFCCWWWWWGRVKVGMGQGPGRVGGKGFQEALNHSGWCGWKGKQFAAVHGVRI